VLEGDVAGPVRWTRTGHGDGALEGDALMHELREQGIELRNPDAAFIEAILLGTPAYPDFAEARRAHVLTDALYRSAAAGGASIAVPSSP
jgi:hypothetical protein